MRTPVASSLMLVQLGDRVDADEMRPALAVQVGLDAEVGAAGDQRRLRIAASSAATHSSTERGREKPSMAIGRRDRAPGA